MRGEVTHHEDGSLTLVIHLNEAEARELEPPMQDDVPVHPSLTGGAKEYCVTCTEGFFRGRRTRIRADNAALAAVQAVEICRAAFSVRPWERAPREPDAEARAGRNEGQSSED
jgi:hypothetical protein